MKKLLAILFFPLAILAQDKKISELNHTNSVPGHFLMPFGDTNSSPHTNWMTLVSEFMLEVTNNLATTQYVNSAVSGKSTFDNIIVTNAINRIRYLVPSTVTTQQIDVANGPSAYYWTNMVTNVVCQFTNSWDASVSNRVLDFFFTGATNNGPNYTVLFTCPNPGGFNFRWPNSPTNGSSSFTVSNSYFVGASVTIWETNLAEAYYSSTSVLDTNGLLGTVTNAINTLSVTNRNIFTTNVQGSPVAGSLWVGAISGTALGGFVTNGVRTNSFEYIQSQSALRVGQVSDKTGGPFVPEGDNSKYSWDSTNTGYGTINFGSNNIVHGDWSGVFGGNQNAIQTNATYSWIGGGIQNLIYTNSLYSLIGGGENNIIRRTSTTVGHNMIGCGYQNEIQANNNYAFIGGGAGNRIDAPTSTRNNRTICGGLNNQVNSFGGFSGTTEFASDYQFLGGGNQCTAAGLAATVVGGFQVAMGGQCDYSFLGGGYNNRIGDSGFGAVSAVIGGGYQNKVFDSCDYTSIVGGIGNSVLSGSTLGFIGGGKSNFVSTFNNVAPVILGGVSNNISVSYAMAIGHYLTNSTTAGAIEIGNANGAGQHKLRVTSTDVRWIGAGQSSSNYTIGGPFSVQTTTVANAGTGQTNLMTVSIPANMLTNSGDRLEITGSFRFAGNADAKELFLIYGSETLLDTTSQIVNSGAGVITAEIIRTGNTTQSFNAAYNGAGLSLFTDANAGTLAQTNGIATTLKFAATCAGSGDVTNQTMTVKYWPGP